eukprot:jgi/Mesen1/6121/ME000312S05264
MTTPSILAKFEGEPKATYASKHSLSSDEVQDLMYAFQQFDVNGDGKISATDLGAVLRCLGDIPTEKELELMVKEFDVDGDGSINLQEFIELNALAAKDEGDAKRSELLEVFKLFDSDGSGFISANELHAVFTSLGETGVSLGDCTRMIAGVDTNGDGYVGFEEFENMMYNACIPSTPSSSSDGYESDLKKLPL